MPSFNSSSVLFLGTLPPKTFWWISSEVKRPARFKSTPSPARSHSRIDPGPMPKSFRTSAGTEICPCTVTLDLAIAISSHYHGNAIRNWLLLVSLIDTDPLYRIKPSPASLASPPSLASLCASPHAGKPHLFMQPLPSHLNVLFLKDLPLARIPAMHGKHRLFVGNRMRLGM